MLIIKNRKIVDDTWHHVAENSEDTNWPMDDIIVPLTFWQQHKDALLVRGTRLGIKLKNTDDVTTITADLPHLAVVALEFPAFADGRAYSQARLLRERHNYQGEIRAIGDVQQDQLFYMSRVGFDAFELRPDKNIEQALNGLTGFSNSYQAAVDNRLPVYRRR